MESFKHELKISFKAFVVIMLLLSVGSASSVVSARHVKGRRISVNRQVHRSHSRARRGHHKVPRIRHRRSGTIRFRYRRRSKRVRRLTHNQINRNRSELYRQTILNINRDRRHHHLRGLKVDHRLSQIGNQRSYQLQRYFSHNTPRHSNEVQYLLQRKHVKYNSYGENIASSPLGTINVLAVGRYDNPTDARQDKLVYYSRNGYQLANNIEDASMNHDKGDQNGHKANILDKHFKRFGVGVSYNPHDKNYYLAVEFIS